MTSDDPIFAAPDEEVKETFTEALLRMYPHISRNDLLCFRVSRVRYVHAISTLNYSARLPATTTSLPGVHVINSAHIVNGTLNVNETVQLAERAAKRLLPSLGQAGASSASRENQTENGNDYEAFCQPVTGPR